MSAITEDGELALGAETIEHSHRIIRPVTNVVLDAIGEAFSGIYHEKARSGSASFARKLRRARGLIIDNASCAVETPNYTVSLKPSWMRFLSSLHQRLC